MTPTHRPLDSVPEVTVVIPVYNGMDLVGRAIDSVLTQTFENLELIVVDDGSTDDTPTVVSSFEDPRVTLERGPNVGLPGARNKGIARARGAFVAFLDHDDYWFPNKLEVQLSILRDQREVVAVGCLLRQESSSGRVVGVSGEPIGPGDHDALARGVLYPFGTSSLTAKRKVVDEIGRFDESLLWAADVDFMARLARVGSLECVTRLLGAHTLRGGSITVQQFRALRNEVRFIQARLAAEAAGRDLSWDEFEATKRLSLGDRWRDRVQLWFRKAGVSMAERKWGPALAYGLLALIGRPFDTSRRLLLKQLRRRRT